MAHISLFHTLVLVSACLLGLSVFVGAHPSGFSPSSLLSRQQTTALRGLAIILVLFTHISRSPYRLSALPGAVGVCLFLILSGFGLGRSYQCRGLDGFFSRRLTRVLIPYWLVLLVLVVLRRQSVEPMQWILSGCLVSFPQGVHGWFLQMIVPLYVVFYLSFRCFTTPRKQVLALFAGSSLLWLLPNAMPSLKNQQIYSLLIGVLLSIHYKSLQATVSRWGKARMFLWLLAVSVPVYALALALRGAVSEHAIIPILMNVALVSFSVLLILGFMCIENLRLTQPMCYVRASRILTVLAVCGGISYELYVCHGPLEWIVRDEPFYLSRMIFLMTTACATYLLFVMSNFFFRLIGRMTPSSQ